MKLVINRCYGGFSLSDAGTKHYAKLKGIELFPEANSRLGFITYWIVPPEKRRKLSNTDFYSLSTDERRAYNEEYTANILSIRESDRSDPLLVQTVEELGHLANGDCTRLKIVEIPDGVLWEIDEYDGMETVREQHRSWS
jgi:hypothetical protein